MSTHKPKIPAGKAVHRESPCRECAFKGCSTGGTCPQWREWYKRKWAELRRLFGHGGQGDGT